MQNLNPSNITDAVLQTFADMPDERLKFIMTSLVKHLHAFMREVDLTEAEWLAGIQFLTATGKISDERRQEFILLSDTLGASALKDMLVNTKPVGATEWNLLGPFYRSGAPEFPLGANLAGDTPGEPTLVSGRVTAPDGTPIPNALLDIWQSDAEGFYDIQLMDLSHMNLRGIFHADANGEFHFRTIKPRYYPIPHDGPVGKMLETMHRHPYRPAHIHFKISAPGYEDLTTEIYVNDSPYLDSDAVFGARSSLIADFIKHDSPEEAADSGIANPFYTVHYDFTLEPA